MAERMFFYLELAVVGSTVFAVFRSWLVQRRYHQPYLFRRMWQWEGLELSFLLLFLPALVMIVGGYLVFVLPSLLGKENPASLLASFGVMIGVIVMNYYIIGKIGTQLRQASRDQVEPPSPPQPPPEP